MWSVFLAKATRTFCYGFLGVLFPIHLSTLGVGPEGIGVAVTLTLASSALLTAAIRRPAERLGTRAVMVVLAGMIVASGVLLATTRQPGLAVLAAMIGNLAVSTGETGPFLSVEQVLVSRAVTRSRLTLAMSLYNLVGYGSAALGSLAISLTGRVSGPAASPRALFWVFAASGLVQILIYARLEPGGAAGPKREPQLRPSQKRIYRLAALFALDALAGGFVVQSLVAYWFHTRFGLPLHALGTIFFATQVLTALSLLIAVRASTRIGLVNTMVFSHLLSNVLLIGMAAAQTPAFAVALLLARALLSQMDVPTRQSYLMSVVQDHERETAATLTNASRTVAQSVSPAVTGYVMQTVGLSAPFVLGGALKIVYDLLLYADCRAAERRLTESCGLSPDGRGG